jgi:alanine racemase
MTAERGQAILAIDLDAVAANWRRLRDEAPAAEVAGVVKADGYGLGAAEIAPTLRAAGCRRFFVAHLDEALTLRGLLPEAAIHVLNGAPADGIAEMVAHDLVPVLNTPGEIERLVREARARSARLPAIVHVDTGMCRLGLDPHEVEALDPGSLASLDLALVMSHLVSAEETDEPLNEIQRRRFDDLRRRLPKAPASLANSSGVFLGRPFHLDLCRPGVALYGVNPTPGRPNPMRPVVTLEAPVLQIHEVRELGTVGYGATWETRPGQRIATVPVGYADGYPRSASSRAMARIGPHEVPVAGRVSMDLITLDVSKVPEAEVRPGTMVTLLGGPDGVDALAAASGTIGYEVLTRLGRRFHRRYIRAASTS